MKRQIFLLLLLSSLAFNCIGQENDAAKGKAKAVDEIFKEFDNPKSPGVSIAVLKDSKTIMLKSYGMANLEHKVPIDAENTVFNIASTSKQFTIFAVMLLEEKGKLSLDDEVQKFIPELPRFKNKITLRQLAVHTSGIRSELQLLGLAGWTPGDVITREHVINMIYRQRELNFEPGEKNDYSNSGYTLLSEVVARVSGQPFEEFMATNILEPLGMNDSFFTNSFQRLIPNMASSYTRFQNTNFRAGANEGYAGSTGLFTTAVDLAKWANNFSNPKVGSKKIIEQMNSLGKLNNGETSTFAYGQFVEKYKGLRHIQHGGSSGGYVSYLGRFPDQNLSVILLGNSSSINTRRFALRVADVFLKDEFVEDEKQKKFVKEVPTSELEKFVGSYWNKTDRLIEISKTNDGLVYDIVGGPRIQLEPLSDNRFRMVGTGTEIEVRFSKVEKGYKLETIVAGRVENTYVPLTKKKYKADELKQFSGVYYSKELDTIYNLAVTDGTLKLIHIRFGDVTLTPQTTDFFTGNSWRFTSIRFERKGGVIQGFRVNSMRVKNIEFEKLR